MTARIFPDAQRSEVRLDHDPEIAGHCHIVFEVALAYQDSEQLARQHWRWSQELFDICPARQVCWFGLHVWLADQ